MPAPLAAMTIAVRLPRTVAARRALLAALFLGGFLALAFLFGGSAQAAEGPADRVPIGHVTNPTGTVAQVADGPSHAVRKAAHTEQAPRAQAPRTERTDQVVAAGRGTKADVVGRTAAPVRHVVGDAAPVAQQARRITEPVGGIVEDTAEGELPVRLPSDGLGAIGLGSLSGGPTHHGDTGGSHDGPYSGRTGATAVSGPRAADAAHPGTLAGPPAAPTAAVPGTVDGGTDTPVVRAADGLGRHGGAPAPFPLPRSPFGTVSQCGSGDSGAPRGGDTHAALPPHTAAYFGLEPGAVHAESAAPTRERFNAVLAFPG